MDNPNLEGTSTCSVDWGFWSLDWLGQVPWPVSLEISPVKLEHWPARPCATCFYALSCEYQDGLWSQPDSVAALEGQTALQMVLVFYLREPLRFERAGAQMLATTWPHLAESSRVGTPGPRTLRFSRVLKMSQKLFSQ